MITKNIFLLVAIMLISHSLNAAKANDVIQIRADEWCPFTCALDEAKGHGIITEIVEKALQKLNIQVEYKVMNWPRAIESTRAGQFHAIMGGYKEDSPDFIFPTLPQFTSRDCFYTLTESDWKFKNIESLKGKKIAIINGYAYTNEIDAFKATEEGKKIFTEANGENPMNQNIQKLINKRVDVMVENQAVINFNKASVKDISKLRQAGCLSDKEIYVAFTPSEKELSQKLAKAVTDFMKDKKQVQSIIKKYGIK